MKRYSKKFQEGGMNKEEMEDETIMSVNDSIDDPNMTKAQMRQERKMARIKARNERKMARQEKRNMKKMARIDRRKARKDDRQVRRMVRQNQRSMRRRMRGMEEGGVMKEDKMMMGGGMMKKGIKKDIEKSPKGLQRVREMLGKKEPPKAMLGMVAKAAKSVAGGMMKKKDPKDMMEYGGMAKKKMMGGGMSKKKDMYEDGGLRPTPEGNKGKGLRKLPRKVRNKMGYMKKGGLTKYGHGGKMPKKGGVAIMIIANKKSKK